MAHLKMSARHPFQALVNVTSRSSSVPGNHLVAACGSQLFLASLSQGVAIGGEEILSRWPAQDNEQSDQKGNEPPSKKRKLGGSTPDQHGIILLAAAPDGDHVVVVSGGDKCMRVFNTKDRCLSLLSERVMPKRPCAIQVTDDNGSIILADKFGDVYQLPLLPSPNWVPSTDTTANGTNKSRTYTPAATETTVHTQRNLKALQEQLKSKGKPVTSKEPLAFEHKIILGHVSMLTDLQLATLDVGGKRRHYIITCDRDEHIRVSRGLPQPHVVDNFCLGHAEFVHRLQVVPESNLLVSGGGDDWMGVWDITTGKLESRKDLRMVQRHSTEDSVQRTSPLAVRDIWILASKSSNRYIVVSCEGIAALALFSVDNLLARDQATSVIDCANAGQVLSMVDLGEGRIAVSTEHQRLQIWTLNDTSGSITFETDARDSESLAILNDVEVDGPKQSELDALLNGVEKLRKRDYDEEGDE